MHAYYHYCYLLPLFQSGAIMAMIAVVGSKDPNAGLSIAFLDQLYPHSFTASTVSTDCLLVWRSQQGR